MKNFRELGAYTSKGDYFHHSQKEVQREITFTILRRKFIIPNLLNTV